MALPAVSPTVARRPRRLGTCIRQDTTDVLYLYRDNLPTYRVWLNIPGYPHAIVTFGRYADALAAMDGALFCGAPLVAIEWIDGHQWTQQVWIAEAS